MELFVTVLSLGVLSLVIYGLYRVYRKYNKTLEPQRKIEDSIEIKTFSDYLKGRDISFWNDFSLPRWTYLLIPVIVSFKEGIFWVIVGELFLVPTMYVFYLFKRQKAK